MPPLPLISANNLTKSFSQGPLFEDISFAVAEGERVAIIGPNGSGKSTLLKICARLEESDLGEVQQRRDLVCSYVAQEDKFDNELSVAEVLESALEPLNLSQQELSRRVSIILGQAGFTDKKINAGNLSGGWRKRLSIIRGLIVEPQLLLLDEPTNHLDLNGILWLEKLLLNLNTAIVFISHDRYFIERIAQRVFELNKSFPNGYYTSKGNYADFIEARVEYWEGLKSTQQSLANRVRREVAWLRQGAKARTTKSKQRTEQAYQMIEELGNLKLENKQADLEFSASNRKTKELIKVEKISKTLGDKLLFKNISLTIMPGVRLGIVGSNGSGKTTFIKTLLGEIEPDQGIVYRAKNLKVAFFDQARKNLNPDKTLKEALCPEGDAVVFNGQSVHLVGWAKRFLFSIDQLELPVKSLSGGEQARVLLAKLMLEKADIILFDEPTNDLDIATLEVLEDCFQDYSGALVLVTHDRYFLDQTTNIILGLTPSGGAIYGDYLQWEEDLKNQKPVDEKQTKQKNKEVNNNSSSENTKKLGYLEQRELSGIEAKIQKEEAKLAELQAKLDSGELNNDAPALMKLCDELIQQQNSIDQLYARWEELENKARNS